MLSKELLKKNWVKKSAFKKKLLLQNCLLSSELKTNLCLHITSQDSLREAGILVRLPSLLAGPDRSVQLAAVMACANLALNTGNMKEMEQAVVVLVLLADDRARKVEINRLKGLVITLPATPTILLNCFLILSQPAW